MRIGYFYDTFAVRRKEGADELSVLEDAKAFGADYLEFHWFDLKKKDEAFRLKMKELSVGASVYAFVDADCRSPEGEALEDDLPAMQQLGIRTLMAVCGSETPEGGKPEAEERIVRSVSSLCEKAKAYGITVAFEDFGSPLIPCGSCEDMVRFGKKIPALRFTLDTGNFSCFGEPLSPSFEKLRDRIAHVHVKDHPTPVSKVECVPGTGCLPVRSILKLLRQDGYDGDFTIEIFGTAPTDDAIRSSADFLRKTF